MKIVYVYADNPLEWNSSEWRCAIPARAINRTGIHCARLISKNEAIKNTLKVQNMCKESDIIVVERTVYGPMLNFISHWRAQGKIIVIDFDDAYHLITPDNPSYKFWKESISLRNKSGEIIEEKINPPPLEQFGWGLRMANAATMPSKYLAHDWKEYTNTFFLPNYIDLTKYKPIPKKHDDIIIGWGGSVSHLNSFTESGIIEALKKVCGIETRVKIMICGNDKRILDNLNLPEEKVLCRSWVPHSQWPKRLSEYDIGIAPLCGNYDDRRSWIKPLEYMVMKIPWIASKSIAYKDIRDYGKLVDNTVEEWANGLLEMIKNIDDYRTHSERIAYPFGISQSIDKNVYKIVGLYEHIINL